MIHQPFPAPDGPRTGPGESGISFSAHVELFESFLINRGEIVEHIQALLNAQRKPADYLLDEELLSRQFEDCFFKRTTISSERSRLRGQLEEAHRASGFEPRVLPGLHNGLVHPAEMMVRVFHMWQQTRWPGRSGRIHYAHTLFNLYLVRSLTLLTMRLWDAGASHAGERLARVQRLLDAAWTGTASGQPIFVRDARWLIPLAQSPATDELGPYFEIAERIAGTLPRDDRLRIHAAGVCLAAGHLRSQTRYYSLKNAAPLDDRRLLLSTRGSNALDFALLIQDLVPLLDAYEEACRVEDLDTRRHLADVICQGISPDPELFVNRIDLLAAYSMIEHLFVAAEGDARAVYTPMGRRHLELVREYADRMARAGKPLADDCRRFRPVPGAYSPYGVLYGFASDLLEHMALKAAQPDAVTPFSLEDVFVADGGTTARLAWVSGWRKLPHLPPEVQEQFEYPHQFAEDVFNRVERALDSRAAGESSHTGSTGRLFVVPEDVETDFSRSLPDVPARFVHSSDAQLVAAGRAEPNDIAHIAADRREGRCIVSYRTTGGWVAISKAVLTDVVGAGHDMKISGLPRSAAAALALMCPDLIVLPTER